jgi:phosphatidylserine/phosphatidylglycerophosphate/cardiolipin synthase-like enzyme/uncharacterized membrane protein YdjX (TVP38/TMEM64 family)
MKSLQNPPEEEPIFTPGKNCWRAEKIHKAALLIDCANYFRALYHAICLAEHSIFITGWDIDGRIELLRGTEAEGKEMPVELGQLLKHKAKENPDLQIYLNKWNYSIFFAREREPLCGLKWTFGTPDNIQYCADYKIPFTACHHQKLIIIDDEIAFCGGMDIALGRWDKRSHNLKMEERVDPPAILNFFQRPAYTPYHDIQLMICGEAVKSLGEIVRWRWKRATRLDPVPLRENHTQECRLWPDFEKSDFEEELIGIARTFPKTRRSEEIREIEKAYIEEISRADNFIYIENQYLACEKIAKALNKRLHERKNLRVLAVSSDHPHGFMEHKSMWSGRVHFCRIVNDGIDDNRFLVTYPVSHEEDKQETIHIHSKIMIVDDKYLHVGSSNLNRRSMGFDSECDITIEGSTEKSQERIAAIRNNLIREHTGREEQDIATIIDEHRSLEELVAIQEQSHQHLLPIDSKPYKNMFLSGLARLIGDPEHARIYTNLPFRQIIFAALALLLFFTIYSVWLQPYVTDHLSEEKITASIEAAQSSPWSIFWVIGIYIVAGLVFFPVMALNLTTAIVFGPLYGFLYAFAGSLCSATLLYFLGRSIPRQVFFFINGSLEKTRHYVEKAGVAGMTMIRLIPIAPFTVINIGFGILKISYLPYIFATFLGLLPGIGVKALFGGAIGELWKNPDPQVIALTIGSLLLWVAVIWGSHKTVSHFQKEMNL